VTVPITATINRAPTATIGALGNGAPGLSVTLDGSASTDPDGDTPLTYRWTLRGRPLSSTTVIGSPEAAVTGMRLDATATGAYEVQLDVFDSQGVKSCQPARSTVIASPAQKLLIELFWDNLNTDLDLHVFRTPQTQLASVPDDCFFQNRRPDWGVAGDSMDDPALERDALTGYGPETFGYVNPINTTYRAVVVFQQDYLTPMPVTRATLRVYQFGILKAELIKTLNSRGETWPVADITWPSGDVSVIP
jgi:hypothetical protein